ncbi:MAG: 5-formyltetrahydrofolate cyclo-ligase [Prevotella sp.]|nr:5-formyltetrahydrofolate cyclo-ligase [Prevotella sp.]
MHKEALRQYIRQQKRQFTPAQLEELSLPVIARLREELQTADTILLYYSLPDEVDTHVLTDELAAGGKTILLPKVTGDDTMELCRYRGRGDLRKGPLHLLEPAGAPFLDYEKIEVAVVPGMAFDTDGHRLGRGRGYYDRFIATSFAHHRPRLYGLCFPFQLVESVPAEAHDITMDKVFC